MKLSVLTVMVCSLELANLFGVALVDIVLLLSSTVMLLWWAAAETLTLFRIREPIKKQKDSKKLAKTSTKCLLLHRIIQRVFVFIFLICL